MNKKKASLIILFGLIIISIGIGVKVHMDNVRFHEEMISEIKKHKDLIHDDLHALDKKKYIKSIQIDYSKVERNPMGGIIVYGYVNNDKSLKFSSGIDKSNINGKDIFETNGTDPSEKLFMLMGGE
ncbi:DUF1310 family protein [Companilactobacillus sp. DQM5]|uniref:DUF1310 family protein n=1 Tax=Companilactobacillus sp. DQM5 TaxID=3463359 RepID=UPI004059175E